MQSEGPVKQEKVAEESKAGEPEKVVIRGLLGTVKWFSVFNHYGFIQRHDNEQDVFVHLSGIIQRGKTSFALDADLEVEMDIASSDKGEKAIAVTLPGGLPIENTRIVRFSRRNFRRPNKSKSELEAEEGEQSKQENEDERPAAADNKSGGKRQKKRFGRRRRGSVATGDEGLQTADEDEKDETPADKSKPKEAKTEEAKPEADLKKEPTDRNATVDKAAQKGADGKKEGSLLDKPKQAAGNLKKKVETAAKNVEQPKEESGSIVQSVIDGAKKLLGASDDTTSKDANAKTETK